MDELPDLRCRRCGTVSPVKELRWRCVCGSLFDISPSLGGPDVTGPNTVPSLWRYQEHLPVRLDPAISLGEGLTPVIESRDRPGVHLKCDFLMPTSSFKDRGAVVLATTAARLGVTQAVADSSGNAGTAAACYFGRAGIGIRVYVPASSSPGKLAQLRAHGADVILVPGSREDTAAAARAAAAEPGVLYASHVYHPYFVHGVKTYGYELFDHFGGDLPATVLVPVGNGTLVLGCYLAFAELVTAGRLPRLPRIVAVQAESCAPLATAFARSTGRTAPTVPPGPTVAEGIAIAEPPRAEQILEAVTETGGDIVTVADAETLRARDALASEGLFVEPTAAVCFAAARAATWPGDVVVPLCGSGLKTAGADHA